MLERLGRLSPTIHRLLLILGCAILYGVWLHWTPLTEWDESRYCEATRIMVTQGDYLVPQFNGAPRYQKPIFYYWVQAPAVKLLGLNERAARLPSALMVLLTVLLLHGMLLRWLEPRARDDVERARARGAAFLGGAALATMPLLAVWGRSAVTDATLTFFTTFTLVALLQADLTEGKTSRRWYLLAALGAGLATLTKGPIGLAVPGLIWLVYHATSRGTLRAKLTGLGGAAKRVPWVSILSLFTLVAIPWYIAITLVDGTGFLQRFLLTENMARYTTVMEGHGSSNPLVFLLTYPLLALLLCFPFSAAVVADAVQPLGGDRELQADETMLRIRRFAWVWVLTILVLFTTSQTKLVSYIQAVAPAAALLFALYAYGRLRPHPTPAVDTPRARWADGLHLALLLLFGIIWTGGMVYVMHEGQVEGPLGAVPFPVLESRVLLIAFAVLAVSWISGVLLTRRRPERQLAATLALWLVIFGLIMLEILPLAVRSQYTLSARVGHYLRRVPAREPIVTYNDSRSESLVYYSRHVVQFYENDTPQAQMQARQEIHGLLRRGPITLVTTAEDLQVLGLARTAKLLHREGNNLILRVQGSARP